MLPSPPAPVKTKDAPAPPALFRPPARLQTSRARFPVSGGPGSLTPLASFGCPGVFPGGDETSCACAISIPGPVPLSRVERTSPASQTSRRPPERGGRSPPLQRRVCRQDHFLPPSGRNPPDKLLDPQVLRTDPVHRRQGAVQDVVVAAKGLRSLEGDDVQRGLDHANQPCVSARVAADRARILSKLRDVEAHRALRRVAPPRPPRPGQPP